MSFGELPPRETNKGPLTEVDPELYEAALGSIEDSKKWALISNQAREIIENKNPVEDRRDILVKVDELLRDSDFKRKARSEWKDQPEESLVQGLVIRLEEEISKNRSIH